MMPEINPIGKYMTEDMNYNLREFARFTENILKGADLAVYLGISNNPEFSYRGKAWVGVVCQNVENYK